MREKIPPKRRFQNIHTNNLRLKKWNRGSIQVHYSRYGYSAAPVRRRVELSRIVGDEKPTLSPNSGEKGGAPTDGKVHAERAGRPPRRRSPANKSTIFPEEPERKYQHNSKTHQEISAEGDHVYPNRGQPGFGLQDQTQDDEAGWNKDEDYEQPYAEALNPNHGLILSICRYCAGVHHSELVSPVGRDSPPMPTQ